MQSRLDAGRRFGPFLLESETGSTLVVSEYQAIRVESGHSVGLQVVTGGEAYGADRREAIAAFLRGAERLAELDHPNLQRFEGAGESDDLVWLSRARLPPGCAAPDRSCRLGGGEVVGRLRPVAALLDQAHRTGLVQGPVTSRHLRVSRSGAPIVTGFDAVWLLRRRAGGDRPALLPGLQDLVSPEQVAGGGAGPPSDVFGLAAIAAEWLTGKPPFAGATMMSVLFQITRGPEVARATGLPAPVVSVLERGLAPEPGDRWRSCEELIGALDAAVRSSGDEGS